MAHRASLILFFLLLLVSSKVSALTVSGTINDSSGNPVESIKVCIMDYNPGWFDTERGCVFTNASGAYTSNLAQTDDDVYIKVVFESPINTKVAPGQKVIAVHDGSSSAWTFSTANHTNGYFPDVTANVRINVPSFPGEPALGPEVNGLTAVREVFAYIAKQGVTGYTCNYDITVDVKVSEPDYWPSAPAQNKKFNVGINRLGEWDSMYHETGHIVQYWAYSPARWPKSPYVGWHHVTSAHSDEGFAILEGWAEGVEILVSKFTGKGGGNLYWSGTWRGAGGIKKEEKGTDYTHFGEPTGSDNSGEVVEGAVGNIIASSNFKFMLEGLVLKSPDRYWDLFQGFITKSGGGAPLVDLIKAQRENGIVYSRAKFKGFEEPAPTSVNVGDGNFAIIDKIAFIRGKVHPKFEQVSADTLNLASKQTVAISKIEMGWAEAGNGLSEHYPNIFFSTWSGLVPFAPHNISFDSADKLTYDRDLDLILRVEDIHTSLDDFYPSFNGDPIPKSGKDYSNNERWLKRLQTWYNHDDYADNDDEGKVIVDNNDPILGRKNFQPAGKEKTSWITGGDGTYVRISPPASKS